MAAACGFFAPPFWCSQLSACSATVTWPIGTVPNSSPPAVTSRPVSSSAKQTVIEPGTSEDSEPPPTVERTLSPHQRRIRLNVLLDSGSVQMISPSPRGPRPECMSRKAMRSALPISSRMIARRVRFDQTGSRPPYCTPPG